MNIKILFTILVLSFSLNGNTQTVWQQNLGGSDDDNGNHIQLTSDGGYISVSTVLSTNGDISGGLQGHHGGKDIFVVKMSSTNTIQWKRCIGGTGDEEASTVLVLPGGDFIVVGHSNSNANDGDLPATKQGEKDVCVFYLTSVGAISWGLTYGSVLGNETTTAYASSALAPDGNIVIIADTDTGHDGVNINSPGGNPGGWLIKINASNGTKIWEKLISGSWGDDMFAVAYSAFDDTYVVVGRGGSPDIPTAMPPTPFGNIDIIVTKVNNTGTTLIWSKMLGGTDAYDGGHGVAVSTDGTIFAVGNVMSTDGDCTDKHGAIWESDGFVAALSANGTKLWTNCVGGNGSFDVLVSVDIDNSQNPVVAGWINGSGGDITNYFGYDDIWVATLSNATGAINTQGTFGGSNQDRAYDIKYTSSGNIITGFSASLDGDLTGNNGGNDIWMFKTNIVPLPTGLMDLSGIVNNNIVTLNWQTYFEENNAGFEIQKSKNAIDFESIGFIKGKGNSSQLNKYVFYDKNITANTNYYRLKQIDYDGVYKYSRIIKIDVKKQAIITLFPNPTTDKLYLKNSKEILNLFITDINGKIVMYKNDNFDEIFVSNLIKGKYYISIITKTGQQNLSFIKN